MSQYDKLPAQPALSNNMAGNNEDNEQAPLVTKGMASERKLDA